MPLSRKISKKSSNVPKLLKEDTFDRISRERREKDAQDKQDAKDKIVNDKIELKRQADIIRPYLDKLEDQIEGKHIGRFWTFPDRSGFKKISTDLDGIKELLLSDIEKYKNRPLAKYTIFFYQNQKDTDMFRKQDIWLSATLTVWYLDDKCNFRSFNKDLTGAHFVWTTPDFEITKFSLKLLEEIMYAVVDKKISAPSLFGFPLSYILQQLKKKKIDITPYLKPLSGV